MAWAAISGTTGYQIGFMAIGVGFLVGLAVRWAGKGLDPAFGLAGGSLSLVGCALGNLLMACWLVAEQSGVPLAQVLRQLDLALARDLMAATFSPMDLLFYGIAVYEGYRLSLRQLTLEDLSRADPASSGEALEPR